MYWLLKELNPNIQRLFNIPITFNNLTDFDTSYQGNTQNESSNKDKNVGPESSFNCYTTLDNQNIFNLTMNDSVLEESEKKTKKTRKMFDETNLLIKSKKKKYRCIIWVSDITMLILIIICYYLAFDESERLYQSSKPLIICGITIIDYIREHPFNHSWSEIFSDKREDNNLTYKIYGDDVTINDFSDEIIIANFYDNFIKSQNNSAFFSEITNIHIIQGYNITELSYKYLGINTKYNDISIPLRLTPSISKERSALLFLSALMIGVNFISYYVSYLSKLTISGEIIPFYSTETFRYFVQETFLFCIFPYPGMALTQTMYSGESAKSIPRSVYFTVFVYFRMILFYKLLKLSKYNNENLYKKCLHYGVKFTFGVGARLIRLESPILSLIIFIFISMLSFGQSIRIFEIYNFISVPHLRKIWEDQFHSNWYIIVSFLSINDDGKFPETPMGHIFTFILLVIRLIVFSQIMTYFTSLSIFGYKEEKCFMFIDRIRIKEKREELYAEMIYYYLTLVANKRKKEIIDNNNDKQNRSVICYSKDIWDRIQDLNDNKSQSKIQNYISLKEMLIEMIEKLENNLNHLVKDIMLLKVLNRQSNYYLGKQKRTLHNMKCKIIALNHLYRSIELNDNCFGKLKRFNKNLLYQEFGIEYYTKKSLHSFFQRMNTGRPNNRVKIRRKKSNEFYNIQMNIKNNNNISPEKALNYREELKEYKVTEEEFYKHFIKIFLSSSFYHNMSIQQCLRNSSRKASINKNQVQIQETY